MHREACVPVVSIRKCQKKQDPDVPDVRYPLVRVHYNFPGQSVNARELLWAEDAIVFPSS